MKKLPKNLHNPMHVALPTVYELIDEFATEKYRRKPWEAGAQRGLLRRFAQSMSVRHVHEITREHVAFFSGEQVSQFYSAKALVALRQFLWYCNKAGYKCIGHNVCRKEELQRVENGVKMSETPSWELEPEWQELEGLEISSDEPSPSTT